VYLADVEPPDPNAVDVNEGDAASTLFGRCSAVLVDGLVAGRSDIELDGVGRIGRDPRQGQSEYIQLSIRDGVVNQGGLVDSGPSV